jgi:hypothetical protein
VGDSIYLAYFNHYQKNVIEREVVNVNPQK